MRRAFSFLVIALFIALVACSRTPGHRCYLPGVGECTDSSHFTVCQNGVWRRDNCRGAKGCYPEGDQVKCDQSLAEEGDTCSSGAACSTDHQRFLLCELGTMKANSRCAGPDHCHLDEAMAKCDERIADVGDHCTSGSACSSDGTALLRCENNAMTFGIVCRGPAHCTVADKEVHCDTSVGAIGDPCTGEGGHACDASHKVDLICTKGVLKRDRACPGGCESKDSMVYCR